MTARLWRIAMVALALPLVWARAADACSCFSSGSPCQAAWGVDVVFAGTVRSIEVDEEKIERGSRILETVVHFDVDEPFINAAAGSVEIVSTGFSTCDYRFTTGQKYVVYARKREDGRLSTGICSRTKPRAEASEDLTYLRSVPKTSSGARVYGRVTEFVHHPADEHGVDYGPLENVTVNVHGATFSRDLLTDEDGRYELAGVPLGTVSISVITPFGFHTHTERAFEVKDLRACVAADFAVRAEATAQGTVVDGAGRPIAGVSVEAVAAELAGYQPKSFRSPARTDERGRFSFEGLPPGVYVFGINLTKGPYAAPSEPPAFLPGTSVAREAAVFELKPGDKTDVGAIRLKGR